MKIILATSNMGKVREIADIFKDEEVVPYGDLVSPFEIEENGADFASNALIKAREVYRKLPEKEGVLVLSDDSGISVPLLGGEPGIYSARYAGYGASDKDNLFKLAGELEKRGVKETPAFYTAAIALISPYGDYVVHGWMHGKVLNEPRGEGGFGYDPLFIPEGYDKTLGELEPEIKREISHRSKALELARPIVAMLRSLYE
ncbi:MAG: non-canonical purine NTP pyrophosphatase [Hydrogenimonas sp.]|nr:non-canonical purine NTP pyrophosphatase [Hydrogenimonas sp.]